MSPDDFARLDFEASGLSSDSWPIEIGLSWIQGDEVRTWATLIKPEPGWPMEAWSPVSAAVHGIPFVNLDTAPDATQVAVEFYSILGNRKLVSDAREFEHIWFTRLLAVIGRTDTPFIRDFDEVTHSMFDGYALDIAYETLARSRAPHRAGPDSARLAKAWLAASRVVASGRAT